MTRILWIVALMIAVSCGKAERKIAPAATATTATAAAEPEMREAVLGKPMPAYTAKLLDGSPFDIGRERGNVVLLNLWATWCGPCRYEIPELEKLHVDLSAQRFKVVGVSVDEGSPEDVKAFVVEQKMTYPVVLDPDGKLADIFRSTVLPTSVLVDRQGKVVWKKLGIVNSKDEELVKAIEMALKS